MAINARGPFFAMREAAKRMGEGGRIVNIASGAGTDRRTTFAPYAANKVTLIVLTKTRARLLAPRWITVNAVAPGLIETEINRVSDQSDVYLFAGITGDLAPNHVNEEYIRKSSYGRRMAHGALLVGFMSTASSIAIEHTRDQGEETPVSLGYDRIRFLGPVFLGDTITVDYTITDIDTVRRRSVADIKVTNQDGDLVAVANHILKWVKNAQ